MISAGIQTRPVLWHIDGLLEVLWYVLAVISVLVFVYGVARPLAKYRRGHREGSICRRAAIVPPGRHDRSRPTGRSATRRNAVGWAHRRIFYGFVILFAGTVILSVETDFFGPVFGWHYFHGPFYLAYSLVLDLFGTALIAGVLVMMVRRGIVRPRQLDYARPDRAPGDPQFDRRVYACGDWVFVVILLVIARDRVPATRASGSRWTTRATTATSRSAGDSRTCFPGSTTARLVTCRLGLWWFHGLLAIAFVAAIPYTKAAHMLMSYAACSCAIRTPASGCGRSRRMAPSRAGYGPLADFTPRHLLQLDACTKCGKCHEVCPANATGRPLSPRDVVLELREQANAECQTVGSAGCSAASCTSADRTRRRTNW